MQPQAIRRPQWAIKARRAFIAWRINRYLDSLRRPDPPRTARDVLAFLVIAAFWLLAVICVLGLLAGIDRWPVWGAALAVIPWGKPDRVAGRMVCESIERTMPHAPWRWERKHAGWHVAHGCAWCLVAVVALTVLAVLGRPA